MRGSFSSGDKVPTKPGQLQARPDPWNDSFAFWNRWRILPDDMPEDHPEYIPPAERITKEEQQAYMDEVKDALT